MLGAGAIAGLALSLSPALGETAAPEPVSIPSSNYAGHVSGLEAYDIPDSAALLMRDPKTGNTIVGLAFDAEGKPLEVHKATRSGSDAVPPQLDIHLPTGQVDSLIAHLRGVSTQEEFDAAVRAWKNGVSAAQAAPVAGTPPAPRLAQLPTKPGDEVLYIALSGARWIAVGPRSAPPVYLLTNITCDACISAWNALLPAARDGKIQLRLVLAPTDEKNMEVLARIAADKDVVGRIEKVTSKAFSGDLPEEADPDQAAVIEANLKANLKTAQGFNIGLPPVIAYESKEGARYTRNAPDIDALVSDLAAPQAGDR